ncbi:ribonuclease Z [Chloracidobacterium validum]|uniref:Ribonuclease Z n=1 Tax=Chloracidobacterium validum TaxID=2821543 RepID=A0ABX8BBI5_9BACT|nr:ribonuclease Z [Chloracidobacterium validum]QUW04298.1 ribonuclease Z [Chloracidobacterium validum]
MSDRHLIALGTSSQVPTRERNHNGYFVRWDAAGLLFDPGEGTQRQMTHFGVAAADITAIFLTHLHGDHCLGLPGVLQRLSLDGVQHPVDLYYPASGAEYVHRLRRASIFTETAVIRERPITTPGVVHATERFRIEAYALDHTVESWGYRLVEPDTLTLIPEKLEAVGLRGPAVGQLKQQGFFDLPNGRRIQASEVGRPKRGSSFAFVMDSRLCDGARQLAAGVDTLLCEATFLESEALEAQRYGHMTARQAATLAREAQSGLLVLTHFSRRYRSTEPFIAEASLLHPNVVALSDGMMVSLRAAATGRVGRMTNGQAR